MLKWDVGRNPPGPEYLVWALIIVQVRLSLSGATCRWLFRRPAQDGHLIAAGGAVLAPHTSIQDR